MSLVKRGLAKIQKEGLLQVSKIVFADAQIKIQLLLLQNFPSLIWRINPRLSGVFLEPTNHCNLHCKMCPRGLRQAGFMDWNLFCKVIDEITDVGNVALVMHMGGESLTHPRFLEMLEYVMARRSMLRRVGFVTNGTLLSEKVQQKVVDLQVDWVTVSLDGLGKVNDAIRIGSKYEVIQANIEGLLEKRGLKEKPNISLSLTDVGQPRKEIEEFVNAWVGKVDQIRVGLCQDKNNVIIDKSYFDGLQIQHHSMCVSPFVSIVVFWNGDVAPCCTDINGVQILGNIQDQSLQSVWKSYTFRKMRYDMATHHEQDYPLCSTCELWQTSIKAQPEVHQNFTIYYESMWKFYRK
jgi:radical SAM protein with 4Fe4S-binding SPASM domain